jgi:hypothetical protein
MDDLLNLLAGSVLDPLILDSLRRRLLLPVAPDGSGYSSLAGSRFRPRARLPTGFWMKGTESLDGIISYLTAKYAGNLTGRGVMGISSSQASGGEVTSVLDLNRSSFFKSADEPGAWVCWDFREMRVRPANYTIRGACLNTFLLEGSLDGRSWTEMDSRAGCQKFVEFSGRWDSASFAVSNPVECRFIKLTLVKSSTKSNVLYLDAVEFFGTLSE